MADNVSKSIWELIAFRFRFIYCPFCDDCSTSGISCHCTRKRPFNSIVKNYRELRKEIDAQLKEFSSTNTSPISSALGQFYNTKEFTGGVDTRVAWRDCRNEIYQLLEEQGV